MIKSKTVFVLGAGSSSEVGLPVGSALKDQISNLLNIQFPDGVSQKSGDRFVVSAMRKLAKETDLLRNDINPLLECAWRLRQALPLALSIDNLLDSLSEEKHVSLVGKLAIARAILAAEANSSLQISANQRAKLDASAAQGTWFTSFSQMITERVSVKNLDKIFDNVAFINFNYDRCVEHFLYHSLQNYYDLAPEKAAEVMSSLTVIHPYGQVGRLPWQIGPAIPVEFGAESVDLMGIAKQIKTFTERLEEDSVLAGIKTTLRAAETICFLGFAYHSQNLELLDPGDRCEARRVFGTAHGISNSDRLPVENDVRRILHQTHDNAALAINNNVKCAGLFQEFWRSLNSAV